jgi:hypothetical protein
VPPLSGTTILWPHAPQETSPCKRALPGRGRPRVWFRSYSACLAVSMVCIGGDVSQLMEGG